MIKEDGRKELFPDDNELAMLLSYVVKDEEAEAVAARLYERYGNIGFMSSCNTEELERIEGVNASASMMLKLLGGIASRRITDGMSFGEKHDLLSIEEYLKGVFMGVGVETLYMLSFDERGRLISSEFVGEGTVCSSNVYPRRLVECALNRSARSVIIAHNHPRGGAEPSEDDIVTTGLLSSIFHSVGITLICHYVVAEDEICRVNGSLIGWEPC